MEIRANDNSEAVNTDIEKMSPPELLAEQSRLQRSQGNMPGEEEWGPALFVRLQKVQAELKKEKSSINLGAIDADIEKMSPPELLAEQSRLQRSQGNMPGEEEWGPALFVRLQKVQEKLKNSKG